MIKKYKQKPAHLKVSIKFWQNTNEELLKIEYLINHNQYSGNFSQEFFIVNIG